MAQLHRDLIRLHSFLDDFLLLHPSKEGLLGSTEHVLAFFEHLHININHKKSNLTPSREVVYLGVLLDLYNMQLRIPPVMVQKVIQRCQPVTKIRNLYDFWL